MLVTAKLFTPPGRGEYYEQSLSLPDTSMPQSLDELATRSFNAIRHFWPHVAIGRALTADKCAAGKRYVVEGERWQVEWANDDYITEYRKQWEKFLNDSMTNAEFLDMLKAQQPTERREL